MLQVLLSHLSRQEILTDAAALACLAAFFFFPGIGARWFEAIEKQLALFSLRKTLALLALALVLVIGRLLLLPWLPVPAPLVQDEFSYLLAADTFAHGRLANPPNPEMKIFLDTPAVNQVPAYVSKYPPAQGAILALGQLLGHPWIGALLSAAALAAAMLWALQGWLPPEWALLGGVIALLRLDLFTYWVNSYWGGALTAIGGALVIGALPRILRAPRPRNALILAVGTALLANSRPYEGLVLCLPAFAFLGWQLVRSETPWRTAVARVLLPFSVVMLFCGLFMGYYNWRTTGNPLLFPYTLNERQYVSVPDFIWQKPTPPKLYADPGSDYMYNRWEVEYWVTHRVNGLKSAAEHAAFVALKFGYFFLWPELCLPLLALPWVLKDRNFRLLCGLGLICFLGSYAVIWFLPHYAAPAIAAVFVLLTEGIHRLRHWKLGDKPVGLGLSRALLILVIALTPLHHRDGTVDSFDTAVGYRHTLAAGLSALPGNHLVLIRDPAGVYGIWVNNQADINHARVVWVREIPGSTGRLLKYFQDRTIWILDAASHPPSVRPYSPGTAAKP